MYNVTFEIFSKDGESGEIIFKQQFENFRDALKVYEGFNIDPKWNRLNAGITDEFRHRDYCLNLFHEGAIKLEEVKEIPQ